MSRFSTSLSKSFLRAICESQMFAQYVHEHVLYNARGVFDTFLAARSLALEESYLKYSSKNFGGHFGWLTLLPDARLVSYNSLKRRRRKSSSSSVDTQSPMHLARGTFNRLKLEYIREVREKKKKLNMNYVSR